MTDEEILKLGKERAQMMSLTVANNDGTGWYHADVIYRLLGNGADAYEKLDGRWLIMPGAQDTAHALLIRIQTTKQETREEKLEKMLRLFVEASFIPNETMALAKQLLEGK